MKETSEISELIDRLRFGDPSERRIAAEMLGSWDERAIYPLIQALKDDNHGVQDAAMHSLISIGGEKTVYMVLPLLREGPYLRNTARVIVREIGRPAVPLIRPLLDDKDDDIRTFGLDILTDIGICDYPEEVMRLLMADPNPNVRAAAARCLGAVRFEKAVPQLIDALDDEEWVAFYAVEALAAIKDDSAVDPIAALLDSRSQALRYIAAEALGGMQSPRATGVLLARLQNAEGPEKTAMLKSLVQLGVTPSLAGISDTLLNMFRYGDWNEKLVCLKGLVDLQEERAIPVIIDIAGSLDPSDPASDERLKTIREALMQFGCVEPLINALRDPAIKYRGKVFALGTVTALNCREAVPAVLPLLGVKSVPVVLAAIDAVAALCGGDAPAMLSHLRGHADISVQERVEEVLSRLP